MNTKELQELSKYMSLVLRHKPEKLNLILNTNGYTSVDILIDKLDITFEELEYIVNNNNKKRFAFNSDKTLIRASQGHSIENINVEYKKCLPSIGTLYHGTAKELESTILKTGLKKMNRNYVHLSKNLDVATNVALRKSKNIVIFKINAGNMILDGLDIFISDNNVYLTDNVPAKYISI